MALEINKSGWKITPELMAQAEEVAEKLRHARSMIEKSKPLCPKHKKPGKFAEWVGSYTVVKALFDCEEGHKFHRD